MDIIDKALICGMRELIQEPSNPERVVPSTLHQGKELIDDR